MLVWPRFASILRFRPARTINDWYERVRSGTWTILIVTIIVIPIRDGTAFVTGFFSFPVARDLCDVLTIIGLLPILAGVAALTDSGSRLDGATYSSQHQNALRYLVLILLGAKLLLILCSKASSQLDSIRHSPFVVASLDGVIMIGLFLYMRLLSLRLHLEENARWLCAAVVCVLGANLIDLCAFIAGKQFMLSSTPRIVLNLLPATAALVVALVAWYALWRFARAFPVRMNQWCVICGYDIRQLSRCPECGTRFLTDSVSPSVGVTRGDPREGHRAGHEEWGGA